MAIEEISKNALAVLQKRYLAKDDKGKVQEDVPEMFRRVAKAVALADANYDPNIDLEQVSDEFYELMTSLRFLPNSPTLMNAGRPLGQLSACFVLPVDDSMDAIFDSVKNAALIHKSGGGTGFSFSRIRQKGSAVKSTGGIASGPVSFMKVFNAATEAVKQGGTRRGANMGVLRIDHPDIIEFINCKADNADITNFNISVGITESFMQAVENHSDYELIDPKTNAPVAKLNAEEVFNMIVDAAWRNGEPGIVFLDRLNRDNVIPSQGQIESTNPCGEQPLLPYESCNLGSINLVKMVKPAGKGFKVDYECLRHTVEQAVHFLDNVIDINNYPLEQISAVTRASRKIGLGVMGWADMLLLLGIPYDSEESVALAEEIMAFINQTGHEASARLAEKRGTFPLFCESTLAKGQPLRNATVTTIAPTGTLSIIGGCSSGIEPVFAYVYIRNIMDGTEMLEVNPVLMAKLKGLGLDNEDLLKKIAREGTIAHCEEIPEEIRRVFVCSHDIDPVSHIRMQAAFQNHTDNAVSKTVNFPNSATHDDVRQVYVQAYRMGCKGVTIYRDGSRDQQVLNIGSVKGKEANDKQPNDPPLRRNIEPRPRPTITRGFTEKMKIGCGTLYITTNYDENGICEVFTSTGKAGGCPSQSEATARLASIALRSGISVKEVCDQLKGIRCPSTIRQSGMSCTSCPDAIAKVIMKVSRFIEDNKPNDNDNTMPDPFDIPQCEPENIPQKSSESANIHFCPECGNKVEHEGGCVICRNCGFSKCG